MRERAGGGLRGRALVVGVGLGVWMLGTVAAAAGPIELRVSRTTKTVECEGRSVEINGSSNVLTLLGDCPDVEINGSSNELKIERTGSIRVNGLGNSVIWEQARRGSRPHIRKTGLNNKVRQGAVAAGESTAESSATGERRPPISVSRDGAKQTVTLGQSMTVETSQPEGGPSIDIVEHDLVKAITCDGHAVNVAGSENTLTVHGECSEVAISGKGNVVALEAASAISVSGNDNDVTWRRGVGAARPRVSDVGTDNSIVKQ